MTYGCDCLDRENYNEQVKDDTQITVATTDDEGKRSRKHVKQQNPVLGSTSLSHANATFGAKMQLEKL